MRNSKILYKYRTRILILLIGLALTFIFSIQVPILFLALYITYRLLGPHLSIKLFNSSLFRIIASFFIYAAFLQCLFLITWLVAKEASLSIIPFISLVILLAIWVVSRPKNKQSKTVTQIKHISKQDIVSIFLATLMILMIVVPSIAATGITKKSSIISAMNGNVDDAAHIGLLNDKISSNLAITYHTSRNDNLRSYGQYPPGWHSLNAILVKAFSPNFQTGVQSLYAYAITKVFWFFILIFTFSKVTLVLSSIFVSKRNKVFYIWILTGIVLFSTILFTDTFKEGFYSFIPQLITALFSVILLIQISYRKPKEISSWANDILILSIVCIGGSLSWLLVLPAFGLMVIAAILTKITQIDLRQIKTIFIYIIKKHFVIYIFLITSLLTQLFLISRDSSSGKAISFLQGIMLNGGISQYPLPFYGILGSGILLLILFCAKKTSQQLKYVFLGLSALLAFVTLLYFLQIYTIDKNAYYYFKSLNIVSTIAAPLSIIGVGMLISYAHEQRGRIQACAMVLFIPIFFILFIGINITSNPAAISRAVYLKGVRIITPTVNESVYKTLESESYNDKNITFYYTPGHLDQNDIPTLLLKSNKPASLCFDSIRLSVINSSDFKDYLIAVKRDCNDYKVTFVTDKNYLNMYRNLVTAEGLNEKVKVLTYEDTFK